MALDLLPSYALFGFAPEVGFSASFHIERVSHRQVLHDGTVQPHRHPHLHQLTYWLTGNGTYILEDERHSIAAGMICWVPAGRIHGFSIEAQSDAIVLSIAREHVDASLAAVERRHGEQVLLSSAVFLPQAEWAAELKQLFLKAERDYLASSWGCQEAIGLRAQLIFIFVGRWLAAEGRLATGTMLKSTLFGRLQAYVESRFQSHPSVAELADELGTTPYLLNKCCRSATGLYVSDYVRRRIMREAERLLLFTVSDIAEIAELTGFSDPSHFTRVFKTLHGQTPKDWRAKTLQTSASG